MPARRILGGGQTCGVSFWCFLTLPVGGGLLVLFSLPRSPVIKQLMQMSAWPRWAISVSALLLTLLLLIILHCQWTTKSVVIQNSRIKNRDAKKYCDKSGCDRNKIYDFEASYYSSSTLNVLHISTFFLV